MNIKDMVENPHEIHKKYSRYWDFLLNSYEGGIDYCTADIPGTLSNDNTMSSMITFNGKPLTLASNNNLFKHKKERDEDYQDRIKQSYYLNFCAPIIDIYTNHLFKQPITEEFGSIEQYIEPRRNNIDRKGSSLSEFRKEIADLSQVYGHIFVLIDMPEDKGELTLQDKINNDKFPYFNVFHPQKIINWSLDQYGRPYWVLVCETADVNMDAASFNKDAKVALQYRLWTRTDWFLYDGQYNLINSKNHNLGKVPIQCIYANPSKKTRGFLGISDIADIAFIARDVYNACSELKQILRDQTFAFLTVQGKASAYNELIVGTNKCLIYPEGTNAPSYVSPPADNATIYANYIDTQIRKMFQLAKLEGGSAKQEQQATIQSGVSKAWDFNETNSALSKKASNLNDGEEKLWQIFARWEGKEFDGSIEYPDEFSIQSLNEDLDEAEKMFKLELGAGVNKEIKEAIIKKKFPRMPQDDIDKLVKSMESGEDNKKPLSLTDKLNLFNRGGNNTGIKMVSGKTAEAGEGGKQ